LCKNRHKNKPKSIKFNKKNKKEGTITQAKVRKKKKKRKRKIHSKRLSMGNKIIKI
jgi:hypothetical protein